MRVFQQRGCKTWRVRFSIEGRSYDEPLKTRNKEVAMEKARTLVREREREAAGILAPKALRESAKEPLSNLLELWLSNAFVGNSSHKHFKNSRNRTKRLFEECGWRYLRDIAATGFEAWRKTKLREGLEPKTLNEYLGHVRCFLNWLEGREMLAANPLKIVKRLPVTQEDEARAFSLEELNRLLAGVPPYRACVYTVAAFTGLRRAELGALEWSSVDLDAEVPTMRLNPSKTKNRKGGTLPIHPDAVEALRALWAMPGRETAKRRGKVFYRGVTRMERFLEDLEEAGISEFDEAGRRLEFHGFRRTWATFLNSGGVPPRVAMGLMRHCDMRLTMRTYTDESLLPMAEALKQTPSVKSSLQSSLSSGKSCQKVAIFDKKRKEDGKLTEFVTDSKSIICESEKVAEGVGFEPTDAFASAVFKTAAINHSTTPPEMDRPPLMETGVQSTPISAAFNHGTRSFRPGSRAGRPGRKCDRRW